MRIISIPVETETECTCSYCDCRFAYFTSDTTIIPGLSSDFRVVYCPHCSRQIRLESIPYPYPYNNFWYQHLEPYDDNVEITTTHSNAIDI